MAGAAEPSQPDDAILWDVVGEHLDEAEFALGQWQAALASPQYTLAELTRGPEERLLAHVDALLIGGPPVADQLLVPLLEAPEDPVLERSVVAALVLTAAGRQDVVWKALSSEDEIVRGAAREAFVLGATPQFDAWLPSQFVPGAAKLSPPQRLVLLDIAARRGLALPGVLESLQSSEAAEVAAAAVAARACDPARHLHAIEHLVDHKDTGVRDAALVTGLAYGSSHTWQRCLALAGNAKKPEPAAMLLVALLGEPGHHALLVEHLSRKTHRAAALSALAYSGQAALVPTLLPLLASDDAAVAKLASAAFATITGVDTQVAPYVADEAEADEDSLPPLEDDDLDADLVPGEEEDLPPPDAKSIAGFWQLNGATFDTRRRLLGGVPWTLAACLDRLDGASMRVRQALGLWLLVRSGGVARLSTQAWSSTQRAQLGRVRSLTEQALVRRFGGW